MVTLQRWSVYWKENGHVTEVVTLMEGEWSCYGGYQFKGGRMVYRGSLSNGRGLVMLERWKFNGGRMVMLLRWTV